MKEEYPSGVKVYDAYSPVARQIYWDHLKKLFDYGIDAWWMDSTDPDFLRPLRRHSTTRPPWAHARVRNLFPLARSRVSMPTSARLPVTSVCSS